MDSIDDGINNNKLRYLTNWNKATVDVFHYLHAFIYKVPDPAGLAASSEISYAYYFHLYVL